MELVWVCQTTVIAVTLVPTKNHHFSLKTLVLMTNYEYA